MIRWSPARFDAPDHGGAESESVAKENQTIDDIDRLQKVAYDEAFVQGYQAGLSQGRENGFAIGKEEGLAAGYAEGRDQGFQEGIKEGADKVSAVVKNLDKILETVSHIPQALADGGLAAWVFETASKLGGQGSNNKEDLFEEAISALIADIPVPGDGIKIHAAECDKEIWEYLASKWSSWLACSLSYDPGLSEGAAKVKLNNQIFDIGLQAKKALIQTAMGLEVKE